MLQSLTSSVDFIYRAIAYSLCHPGHLVQPMLGYNPYPICFRETGMFVGFLAAFLILAITHKGRPGGLPRVPVLVLMGVLLGLMAVDGLTVYSGVWRGDNSVRLLTGLGVGFSLAALLFPAFNSQLWHDATPANVLSDGRALLIWLAGIPVTFLIIRLHPLYLGYLMPHIAIGSVLALLATVNLLTITLVPRFERAFKRWRQLIAPVAGSLALALVELGGFFAWHRIMH